MVHFFTKRQNVSAPKGLSSVAQVYKTELNFIHTHQVLSLVHLPPLFILLLPFILHVLFCTLVQLKKALLEPKRFAFW